MAATTWTQVGVQSATLYPWTGSAGPYNTSTAINLFGIQNADISVAVESVEGKSGDTVFTRFVAEVGRDITIKMQAFKIALDAMHLLWGGRFVNDNPGAANESQYLTPDLLDRAPDLRLVLRSIVGDGAVTIVAARCKAKGAFSFNMKAREIIMPEMELALRWDETYVTQDGNVGGIIDFLYSASGLATRS